MTVACAWVTDSLALIGAGEQMCVRCFAWGSTCPCGEARYPWRPSDEQRAKARAERWSALARANRGEPCCDACSPPVRAA